MTKAFTKTQKKAIVFPEELTQLISSFSNSLLLSLLKELFSLEVILSRQIEIVNKLADVEVEGEERKVLVQLLSRMIHLPPNPYYLHNAIFSSLKKIQEKCDESSYNLAVNGYVKYNCENKK